MPLPLVPIAIVALTGLFVGRKVHDACRKHPKSRGYCSNCGKICAHVFHESGLNWKKNTATAVLTGAAGLGVGALLVRNIYKCSDCGYLTLPCRTPGCKGMARTGDYYDDEFCGKCRTANDKSKYYSDLRGQKSIRAVQQVVMRQDEEIRYLKSTIERERSEDKDLIRKLKERLKAVQAERLRMTDPEE